jgi:hypothetical protein
MKNLDRRNPSGSTRRNFLKGAGLFGLTLTAGAGRARGQPASVVVINEDGSVSTNANTGAAKWISPSACVVSSLETGNIVTLTAWGGDEYGYAYTYTLSGAPKGVTIDADTGRLNVASALSVGDKTFTITATNREDNTKTANFTFTLHVLRAVTSGTPTSGQIRHATFDPHSGTWGRPSGNDWTNVFNAMHTAIISLQNTCNAVADESLRVFIPLARGTTYQYTNNQWTNGIQYLQVYDTGSGAPPILQCTRSTSSPQIAASLNQTPSAGAGPAPGSIFHQEGIKVRCATIATVAAGSTTVTLLNAGDASKIKIGRWHQVMGSIIQIGGFPPNVQFIDFVKVTNVSGTTVTLDRPLKYGYDQTWYENPNDDQSLGVARLAPLDTGGTGGYIPTDPRLIIRGLFTNINFLSDPNYTGSPTPAGNNVLNAGLAIDLAFNGCSIPYLQITVTKHVYMKGCTATWSWEPDKESETIVFDGITTTGQIIQAATGFQYALFRNSTCAAIQMSPRQLRAINTTFSAVGDPFPGTGGIVGVPVTFAFQGPLQFWDFGAAGACGFTHGPNGNNLINAYNAAFNNYSLVIGTDATWSGNQLRIQSTFTNFQNWLIFTAPGAILSTVAAPPFSTNWGYVASMSSPGDGTALWLNVVWVNGTKPTSGTLYAARQRWLLFGSGNTLSSGTNWASPGFAKKTATGCETGWDFPAGYLANLSG